MTRILVLGSFAVLFALPSLADESRSHDGGFFLRLAGGGGSASSKIEDGFDSLEFSGPNGNLDIAIGAVVKKNLAIHGSFGGWSVINPTAKVNGLETSTEDLSLTMSFFGGGLTYYLGPSNVYLTASVGAASLRAEIDGEKVDSSTGFAFDAAVGKEWWIGDRWGIGVSGAVGYHSVPPGDVEGKFKGPSFGVRFSATMN